MEFETTARIGTGVQRADGHDGPLDRVAKAIHDRTGAPAEQVAGAHEVRSNHRRTGRQHGAHNPTGGRQTQGHFAAARRTRHVVDPVVPVGIGARFANAVERCDMVGAAFQPLRGAAGILAPEADVAAGIAEWLDRGFREHPMVGDRCAAGIDDATAHCAGPVQLDDHVLAPSGVGEQLRVGRAAGCTYPQPRRGAPAIG